MTADISLNALASLTQKVADKLDKAADEQFKSPCEDATYNLAFTMAELAVLTFSLTSTVNGIVATMKQKQLQEEGRKQCEQVEALATIIDPPRPPGWTPEPPAQ